MITIVGTPGSISNAVQNWAPTINAIFAPILTIGIIWLYFKQTKILKEQKNLSAAQHRAHLSVENYLYATDQDVENNPSLISNPGGDWKSDQFYLFVSNHGRGVAEDLHLDLEIMGADQGITLNTPLTQTGILEAQTLNKEGGIIGAETQDELFLVYLFYTDIKTKAPPHWIPDNDEVPKFLTPTEILWLMQDAGEKKAKVEFRLNYKDGTGVRDSKRLASFQFSLRDFQDFRRAFDQAETMTEPLNSKAVE